jgi:hypothetical protein
MWDGGGARLPALKEAVEEPLGLGAISREGSFEGSGEAMVSR